MMRNFAFISRHEPTAIQRALARERQIVLFHVGDMDAFRVFPKDIARAGEDLQVRFSGVVVVHPAAALNLISAYDVGVFENAKRGAIGTAPEFYAKALYLFTHRRFKR